MASGRPSIVACQPGNEATRSRRTWADDALVTTRTCEGLGNVTGTAVPGRVRRRPLNR